MNEVPLHPALVHLPIAFVLFAPLFAAYVLREIHRLQRAAQTVPDGGDRANVARDFERRHWRLVALWAFVQAAVVYATMVTGELDADRFEDFLTTGETSASITPAERAHTLEHIEAHEDGAGLLLFASIVVFFWR